MNSTENFLRRLEEIVLVPPGTLTLTTTLNSLENWDSMAQVAAVALFDELGAKLPPGGLEKAKTVQDLFTLIGLEE